MGKLFPLVALVALLQLVGAPSVDADIIFTLGNNPQPDEQVILFSGPETGTTIIGKVDHTGVPVVFKTLTGQTLFQNAQGQADIQNAADPGHALLTSLDITTPGFAFHDFILNPNNGSGSALVTATDNMNQTFTYVLGNGQNFLTLTTINNEAITHIAVTEAAGSTQPFGWQDVKQPRASGLCVPGAATCTPVQIPEPTTLALVGGGLAAVGFVARRSRRDQR